MNTETENGAKKIRLLAIDIDGTLLDHHKSLTPRTQAAIAAAQEAGIIVTLATARRYRNSRQYAEELGLTSPLITYDGALTLTHPQRDVIQQQPLAANIAQQAAEIIARHRIQPIVHRFVDRIEETWAGLPDLDHPELQPYFAVHPNIQRLPVNELCVGRPDPLRVIVFASEEAIAPMLPEIAALDCAWYTIKRGSYGSGELTVMNKACTKASGVIALAQRLEIPLEQVMAIGDNVNDLEMLQAVGWGVAMGHAPDLVRAAANAVTASNREEGVALAIERYALDAPRAEERWASSNSRRRAT
jgi:Cof subfamily protein (haloacid dehalogenase superfamily)